MIITFKIRTDGINNKQIVLSPDVFMAMWSFELLRRVYHGSASENHHRKSLRHKDNNQASVYGCQALMIQWTWRKATPINLGNRWMWAVVHSGQEVECALDGEQKRLCSFRESDPGRPIIS